MLYPKSKEPLTSEQFASPSNEYRAAPFGLGTAPWSGRP